MRRAILCMRAGAPISQKMAGGGKYFQKSEKYSMSRSSLSKGNLIGEKYSFESKKYSCETFCEGSKGKLCLQNVQNMYSLVVLSKELSKLWSN